jgi:hypothetical protein
MMRACTTAGAEYLTLAEGSDTFASDAGAPLTCSRQAKVEAECTGAIFASQSFKLTSSRGLQTRLARWLVARGMVRIYTLGGIGSSL